jgi:hypothetical protein
MLQPPTIRVYRAFGRRRMLCYIASWMELVSPLDYVKRNVQAVVVASVLILAVDAILTQLFITLS